MIEILCVLTSLLVLVFLLLPFFVGSGGSLFAHSALASEESLEAMRESILSNYLKCEGLYEAKQLSKREWDQRKIFLTHRFLDATRRLDAIRFKKRDL